VDRPQRRAALTGVGGLRCRRGEPVDMPATRGYGDTQTRLSPACPQRVYFEVPVF
jgi:hypothetical protein